MREVNGTYRYDRQCNFFGFQRRGRILLLSIFALTAAATTVASPTSQPDDQIPRCPVNQRNDKKTCEALLSRTNEHCEECYIFCNGRVVSCAGYGEELVPFECVGSIVAGCSKDMLSLQADEGAEGESNNDPSSSTTINNVDFNANSDISAKPDIDYEFLSHVDEGHDETKEKNGGCAVTVNAIDSVCAEYMTQHQIDSTSSSCDCSNFCNGQLIDCLEFGERKTFSCSGELVAGCLQEQRYTGTDSAAAASLLNSRKLDITTTTIFLGGLSSLVQALALA